MDSKDLRRQKMNNDRNKGQNKDKAKYKHYQDGKKGKSQKKIKSKTRNTDW